MATTAQRLDELLTHPTVAALATVFDAADHRLLLVGGSVRDALSDGEVDDLDFTTDARPETIRRLVEPMGTIWEAGADFGTIGVHLHGEKVEITTFRAERYDDGSRKPEVAYSDDVADDLVRRDLTINAIALDVVTGELVDPFDGAGDLARGVLRCPGNPEATLHEDPLRILRVVRFAARTGFEIDPSVTAAIAAKRDRLSIVARERCTAELLKLVGNGPATLGRGLAIARELGVDGPLVGELSSDAAATALRRADASCPPLAVLAFGRSEARAHLRELRIAGEVVDPAVRTAEVASRLVELDGASPVDVRRLVRDCRSDQQVLTTAAGVAGAHGVDASAQLTRCMDVAAREPQVTQALPVDGHDLLDAGLSGRGIGAGLRAAEQVLLEQGTLTREQALRAALDSRAAA